jgi:hypothetical protein
VIRRRLFAWLIDFVLCCIVARFIDGGWAFGIATPLFVLGIYKLLGDLTFRRTAGQGITGLVVVLEGPPMHRHWRWLLRESRYLVLPGLFVASIPATASLSLIAAAGITLLLLLPMMMSEVALLVVELVTLTRSGGRQTLFDTFARSHVELVLPRPATPTNGLPTS